MQFYLVRVTEGDSDSNHSIVEERLFSTEESAKKYQTLMEYKYWGDDITLENIILDEINPDDYKYYTEYKLYLTFPPDFGLFSKWDICHILYDKNICSKSDEIKENLLIPDVLKDRVSICLSSLDKQKIIDLMFDLKNNFDKLYIRSDTLGGYIRRDIQITQYYVKLNIKTKEFEDIQCNKIEANGLNCDNKNLFEGEVRYTNYIEVYSTESIESAKKRAEEIYESLR